MKIRLFYIFMVLLFITSPKSFAASMGDAITPIEQGKLTATVEYTHVFERDGDVAGWEFDEYDQIYANIAYGVANAVKIYTRLGIADMSLNGVTSLQESTEQEYDFGFLWGGGISGNLKLENNWFIGFDAQFTRWDTDIDSASVNGVSAISLSGDIKNQEWQVALYGGKNIEIGIGQTIFTPYIGIKLALVKTDVDGVTYSTPTSAYALSGTLKNDTKFGVSPGANLKFNDNIKANIEGQFVDETGVTVGLTYKF